MTPLPPGMRASSILSQGLMPRCSNASLRKVTCPREVTVSVVMSLALVIEIGLDSKVVTHCYDRFRARVSGSGFGRFRVPMSTRSPCLLRGIHASLAAVRLQRWRAGPVDSAGHA